MRLLIAGFTLILTTVAALAQMSTPQMQGNGSRIGQSAAHAADGEATIKPKVNDKAYESALKNLPDKQYDPWRGVR